jgi:hypothetical protein
MATNSLNTARDIHTATLLPNGQVLVAGGQNGGGQLSGVELYDPVTGTWLLTNSMNTARGNHTATLLPNGKVLVAGGYNAGNSAELYDPATGKWTPTGPLNVARYAHTATLLPNGKVLVAAGFGSSFTNSAELYDPATGAWTTTGSLNTARYYHTATLLPNGKVLVAGGQNLSGYLASAELYDPATGTWTTINPLNTGRVWHTATLLPNGKVLAIAGYNNSGYLNSAELYDPASGTWTTTGSLATPREYHKTVLLPDGRDLITGGFGSIGATNSTELYNVGLGFSVSWQPQIVALTSRLNLGGNLVITGFQFRGIAEGSGGNSMDSSADYPLVQLRRLDNEQTVFLLTTNWSTNSFASSAVWNFPPGYALATVFVNGIQSTSSVVNISVPVPTTATLTGPQKLTNGFHFAFANSAGALFGVLTTTNLALPLTSWTALGGVTEISPGQFQFTDPQATNGGQRFYRAFAP